MSEATERGEPSAAFGEHARSTRGKTEETTLPRAAAASRETDQVLAKVCHDMRTPLSVILGFSELLKTEVTGPHCAACYDAYCGQIHKAAAYLLNLVNDIMDYAKAGSGADAVELEHVDVAELVHATVALMRVQASAARLNLDVSVSSDIGMVRTDKTKLRQILLNLISNAIKFTRPGGRIFVEAALANERDAMTLRILDNGIGIAPEDLVMAMRPFGQIKAAQKNAPKGSGLGLPLTKRYAELLGGTVEIKSHPGAGTAAIVRLPIHPTTTANAAELNAQASAVADSRAA